MKIRKAEFSDWKTLLDWRNDSDARKNSHNSDVIDEISHKKWLQFVLSNKNINIFIAYVNDIAVVSVRVEYDVETETNELSWMVGAEFRGLGYGKIMVKCISEMLQGKFRAEIKADNISSVKIAEYCNMSFRKNDNGILHFSNNL